MFILSRNHNSCTTYPHIGGSCIRRTDQDRRRKQRELDERWRTLFQNRKNAEGAYEVTAYKAKDNSKEVLIPANMLLNPQTGKPISVRNFIFSEDNSKVLIYTNTRRVWRYDTRGDYWVLNLKTANCNNWAKACRKLP